ncbi:MAG: ribonuclease [Candidatus Saccharibacteria bacterium]|nr:ribonuclease [Candidatus Saccharibacteria bacterium]
MNIIEKYRNKIDAYQQKHSFVGFPYAVIKKYGEDEAGYQSALLTYYGFLALFPLLLVAATVVSVVAADNPHLQKTVLDGLTSYFPTFRPTLEKAIGTIGKTGLALVIGVLFTLYGARGVADAFRNGVNKIWHIPRVKRDGFPKSIIKSLSIVIFGGLGFLVASLSTTLTAAAGHGWFFTALSIVVNLIVLFFLFGFLLTFSLPGRVTFHATRAGAATAAIGLVLIQIFGQLLLKKELRNLNDLYSVFAIPLGLLFWLYLQAQIVFYSIEIAAVRSQRLWPRGLDNNNPTKADKRAYTRISASEQYLTSQKITSKFHK